LHDSDFLQLRDNPERYALSRKGLDLAARLGYLKGTE
jgi:hypothetical protein